MDIIIPQSCQLNINTLKALIEDKDSGTSVTNSSIKGQFKYLRVDINRITLKSLRNDSNFLSKHDGIHIYSSFPQSWYPLIDYPFSSEYKGPLPAKIPNDQFHKGSPLTEDQIATNICYLLKNNARSSIPMIVFDIPYDAGAKIDSIIDKLIKLFTEDGPINWSNSKIIFIIGHHDQ